MYPYYHLYFFYYYNYYFYYCIKKHLHIWIIVVSTTAMMVRLVAVIHLAIGLIGKKRLIGFVVAVLW